MNEQEKYEQAIIKGRYFEVCPMCRNTGFFTPEGGSEIPCPMPCENVRVVEVGLNKGQVKKLMMRGDYFEATTEKLLIQKKALDRLVQKLTERLETLAKVEKMTSLSPFDHHTFLRSEQYQVGGMAIARYPADHPHHAGRYIFGKLDKITSPIEGKSYVIIRAFENGVYTNKIHFYWENVVCAYQEIEPAFLIPGLKVLVRLQSDGGEVLVPVRIDSMELEDNKHVRVVEFGPSEERYTYDIPISDVICILEYDPTKGL